MPDTCLAPMLATLGVLPRVAADFTYEVKWDGYGRIACGFLH